MNHVKRLLAAAGFASLVSPLAAAPITLDFEGLGNLTSIDNFYNGGTDSEGNAGFNYGVGFGSNTLALLQPDPQSNFSNEPSPITIMFFLSGSAVLNYTPGFDTGFSFFYTSTSFASKVNVWSDVNATGTLLGEIDLPALGVGPDPANEFSNWDIGSLAFAGQAKSIDFTGTVNQVGFDNITFGSTSPLAAPIPEPGTYALMALGLAGVTIAARWRKAT
jgi:hypothetical protein